MTFLHLIVASSLSYLQDSKNFSAARLMGSRTTWVSWIPVTDPTSILQLHNRGGLGTRT